MKPPATPRRVLIVDDEPAVAALLRRVLEAEGHHTAVAGNGRAALERVADRNPDLVILDVDMPEVDGFEVCRRLKAASETRLPVLVLSGTDTAEARLRA